MSDSAKLIICIVRRLEVAVIAIWYCCCTYLLLYILGVFKVSMLTHSIYVFLFNTSQVCLILYLVLPSRKAMIMYLHKNYDNEGEITMKKKGK